MTGDRDRHDNPETLDGPCRTCGGVHERYSHGPGYWMLGRIIPVVGGQMGMNVVCPDCDAPYDDRPLTFSNVRFTGANDQSHPENTAELRGGEQ